MQMNKFMATIIHDKQLEERLRAERVATGADRYDEVWKGTYMLAPMPNNEHQFLVARLTRILDELVTDTDRGMVFPGANVSDRIDDWQSNYRVPDVAVFLHDSVTPGARGAENHGAFWFGGPDLAIEIVSANDLSREKLEFYANVGTRELLILDRDPWLLEFYQLRAATLGLVATTTPNEPQPITLETCPLQLALQPNDQSSNDRPQLIATSQTDGKIWVV